MMKTKVVKLSSVLLTLSLLVACSNNVSTSSSPISSSSTSPSSSSTTPVVEKALSSIEMGTKPSKVEYQLGESLDVTGGIILAKYQDGTQDNIGITKEMVAVSDISTEGTKTVTVSYTYKGVTKTTSYEVTYKAKALQVSAVAFDKDTEVVRVGSAIILNPTISPSSLTRNDLIWTSSNNSVATVSNMGIVTGISNGGVTITATSKTDDSIKATIKVYVLLNVSSSQVSVSYANYTYDATTDTLTILSGGTWPSFNEPGILDGTLASLIIANSVGEGEVTVSNLTVTGDTTINGGGKNSVIFSSCTLKNIVINKIKTNDEQPVRVQIDETTEVQSDISILATGTAGAIITSNSPVMKVYAGSDVQLTGTSVVNELEITGSDIEASVAVPLTTLTVASTGTNASITASSPVENTIIGAAATLSATANLNNVTINAPTTLTSSAQVNTITAGANVVYGGSGNVTNLDINTANVAATLNGNVTAVNVTVTGANVSGTGSLGLIKTNNSLTVVMDTTLQNTSASNIQVTNSTSTNSVAVPTSNVVTINSTTTESSKVASVKTGGTVSASNAVAGYDAIKLGLYDQAEQTAIKSRYASLLATLTGPSADTALACKTYLVDTATATPYIKKFEVAGDGTNYTDYTAVAVSGNGNIVINYNLINAEAYAPTYKYTYVIADSDDVDILDEEVAVAAANFKNTANDANMSVAVKNAGTTNSYKVAIDDATQGKANATLQAIVSNKIDSTMYSDANIAALIAANHGKTIYYKDLSISIDADADKPTYLVKSLADLEEVATLAALSGTALDGYTSIISINKDITLNADSSLNVANWSFAIPSGITFATGEYTLELCAGMLKDISDIEGTVSNAGNIIYDVNDEDEYCYAVTFIEDVAGTGTNTVKLLADLAASKYRVEGFVGVATGTGSEYRSGTFTTTPYVDMWGFWHMKGMVDADGNECPRAVLYTDETLYRDLAVDATNAEAWVSAKYLYDTYMKYDASNWETYYYAGRYLGAPGLVNTRTLPIDVNITLDMNSHSFDSYYGANNDHSGSAMLVSTGVNVIIKNGTLMTTYPNGGTWKLFRADGDNTISFINCTFTETTFLDDAVQFYVDDDGTGETVNFAYCTFTNAGVSFDSSSGSEPVYDVTLKDCSFTMTNAGTGAHAVYFDYAVSGTALFDNCDISVAGTGNAITGISFYGTDDMGDGKTLDVTLKDIYITSTSTGNGPSTYSIGFPSYNRTSIHHEVTTDSAFVAAIKTINSAAVSTYKLKIMDDITLNESITINKDIIFEAATGKTLTIGTGGSLTIAANYNLVLEPGVDIVVNGGTLTKTGLLLRGANNESSILSAFAEVNDSIDGVGTTADIVLSNDLTVTKNLVLLHKVTGAKLIVDGENAAQITDKASNDYNNLYVLISNPTELAKYNVSTYPYNNLVIDTDLTLSVATTIVSSKKLIISGGVTLTGDKTLKIMTSMVNNGTYNQNFMWTISGATITNNGTINIANTVVGTAATTINNYGTFNAGCASWDINYVFNNYEGATVNRLGAASGNNPLTFSGKLTNNGTITVNQHRLGLTGTIVNNGTIVTGTTSYTGASAGFILITKPITGTGTITNNYYIYVNSATAAFTGTLNGTGYVTITNITYLENAITQFRTAYGDIRLSASITADATMPNLTGYVIASAQRTASLTIYANKTLTIETGNTINFANGSKLVVNGTLNNSGTLSGVEGASVVVDSAGTMSGTYSNFYDATETAITSIVAGTYNWNTTLNGWELAA